MRATRLFPSLPHLETSSARIARWAALLAFATAIAIALFAPPAGGVDRSGKEVVLTVCATCHATGKDRAPRIGDDKAWAARAEQGLSALSAHAVNGIRNMPAHGGNAGVTDTEIARAVTYMVNRSGGHWIEPRDPALALGRNGEELVRQQCAKCHQDGLNGAPKIGDRAAWTPRMSKGIDELVKSAVHGHGAMPARGGIADLSEREIQSAVVYMFNYGVVAAPATVQPVAMAADPFHKVVAGTDVYLGVVKAEAMPAAQRPAGIAAGKGYHHLNISLSDVATHATVADAHVKVLVTDATGIETHTLDPVRINDSTSYGGWFRMNGNTVYTITAQIERAGGAGVLEAKFQYKAW
jgi:cytochrome c5